MRKIVLLCAMGMSTSLLVNKIKEEAKKQQYDIDIAAHPISTAVEVSKDADIVLLGPQVRFQLTKLKEELSHTKVEAIDMLAYGTMNGAKVIEQVKKALGD